MCYFKLNIIYFGAFHPGPFSPSGVSYKNPSIQTFTVTLNTKIDILFIFFSRYIFASPFKDKLGRRVVVYRPGRYTTL